MHPNLIRSIDATLDDRFKATPFCEGGFYGQKTKRFGSLLTRAPAVANLIMHRRVLESAETVLLPGCSRIALNLTQAIEIHPGGLPQLPHRDQDMWPGPKGGFEYLVNVMWPLTPFHRENGGTRLWPSIPADASSASICDELVPDLEPGDALLFLGSVLHGAGGNSSREPRRGIVVSYCLGWLKPFELQWLVYPPVTARHFSSELAALVGYAQHRPNLGNVEGQCPSFLLGEYVSDYVAAVDALLPEQTGAVNEFTRSQMHERKN